MKKAALTQDPLTAGKLFISCCQRSGEKATYFVNHLKKLFKQAYPDEDLASSILQQSFLTGLVPHVSQQILLCGKPTTFKQAVQDVKEVKYVLNFETKPTEPVTKDFNMINKPHVIENPKLAIQ